MKRILERLLKEEPAGRKNRKESLREVRRWVKEHEEEIAEALRRGYSWKQITEACVREWLSLGKFGGIYLRKHGTLVADSYYAVKEKVRTTEARSLTI